MPTFSENIYIFSLLNRDQFSNCWIQSLKLVSKWTTSMRQKISERSFLPVHEHMLLQLAHVIGLLQWHPFLVVSDGETFLPDFRHCTVENFVYHFLFVAFTHANFVAIFCGMRNKSWPSASEKPFTFSQRPPMAAYI